MGGDPCRASPWKHDDRALLGKTQSDYAAAVMPAE